MSIRKLNKGISTRQSLLKVGKFPNLPKNSSDFKFRENHLNPSLSLSFLLCGMGIIVSPLPFSREYFED